MNYRLPKLGIQTFKEIHNRLKYSNKIFVFEYKYLHVTQYNHLYPDSLLVFPNNSFQFHCLSTFLKYCCSQLCLLDEQLSALLHSWLLNSDTQPSIVLKPRCNSLKLKNIYWLIWLSLKLIDENLKAQLQKCSVSSVQYGNQKGKCWQYPISLAYRSKRYFLPIAYTNVFYFFILFIEFLFCFYIW